jgi:tRNA A-37 threonylcarbamoyl transferase component Bud32/tetratricopeptide (TPR) repeat protein
MPPRTPHDDVTAAPSDIRTALIGRYDVEREIGRGGSATVYLARDEKHRRLVAIKVLDPDVGAALGADRFAGEIRVTANLQHPNILPLFDSGDANGALFYVMPFVEGESLRVRLEREGALAIDESIRIVTAVAHAIDYAHRRGIIHRDIKPENIMFSDGVPVVADFGIAKAIAAACGNRPDRDAGATDLPSVALTMVGMSLGTPAYMSPEQAMGEVDIDGRSDVYALGCLLYEMLTGKLPFDGPTSHAIIAKHLMTPVPSVRDLREAVPPMIDAAVARAMAKEPAARFATPAEFGAALVAAPAVEPKPDYSRSDEPLTRTSAPFVGRQKELGELLARLGATEQGSGGLVLIGGEPGVGKTRLVEAVLVEARARGCFCTLGHCYEMEGAPPYLPMVEQVEYAMRVAPPGRLRAALGDSAAEIARVVPSLRQAFPDIGPPLDLPPDQQRHYLFTRFREYLERSSSNVPLVLLFDDLHWADESTLLLLEHLAQHAPRMRLLMLGTYRDVDLDVGRPFAKSIERMARQRVAERITLRRMPRDDVAGLLASLGAPDPPPALVDAIFHETEGNPFFIEEVFRHLRDEGRVLDEGGHWLRDIDIAELEVPEGVRLVIGRRLERAGERCRAVLAAAAVIGPRFDLRLLQAVADSTEDDVLDALEAAERAGLILAQHSGRDTRYAFSHELIRQTLLSSLSLPRRQRRHQKTAEAIEKVYVGRMEERIADLAYHMFQAGAAVDTDRVMSALLAAARQALAAGAFAEACAHVDRALSITEGESTDSVAELRFARASAFRGMGLWSDAIREYDALIPRLCRLRDPEVAGAAAADLVSILTWMEGNHSRILELLTNTLEGLPGLSKSRRSLLIARAGMSTAIVGGFDAGVALVEQAIALAGESGDVAAVADTMMVLGMLQYQFARIDDSIRAFERARPPAERLDRRWELATILSFLGSSLTAAGRLDESRQVSAAARQMSESVGHIGGGALAALDLVQQDWIRAADLGVFDEAVEFLLPTQAPAVVRENAVWARAAARFEGGGDPDPARDMVGAEDRVTITQWKDGMWILRMSIDAYCVPDRARESWRRYGDRIPRDGRPMFAGPRSVLAHLVEALAVLGADADAASLYAPVKAAMDDGHVLTSGGVVEIGAAIAATCAARWDVAEVHFGNARATAERLPHAVAQAEVRRWHSWMLRRRGMAGDAERAGGLLDEALAVAERYRLPRRVMLCRENRM